MLPMLRKTLLIISLSGLLAGCALPGAAAVPTPYPADYLPTVIYLTAESINATIQAQTRAAGPPTETPMPTPTPIPPTLPPTLTPTPAPGVPLAAIQIQLPGPMSKVASPLQVRMTVVAGKSGSIQIDLFGEDGRLLGRKVERVPSRPIGEFVATKLPFQIRAAAEVGLLQVGTKDEHGRLQSLSSVRLLLLSAGSSEITPPGNNIYERCVLYNLPLGASVSGGTLALEGKFLPYNKQPVVLELITADGQSVGLRVLAFNGLDPQDFKTTIPYKIDAPTLARLFVRQADDIVNGPVYVYSQEIMLNP